MDTLDLVVPYFIHGFICVTLSFFVFKFINENLKKLQPPVHMKINDKINLWRWRNLLVSFLHSLLIGIWDILW